MKKRILPAVMLILLLMAQPALAASVPQELLNWYQESYGSQSMPKDYLEFHLPDGTAYGFLLHEGGYSMSGYKKETGVWQQQSSGQSIGNYDPGFLRRHDTRTARPDGSFYPDDLGFDFISSQTGAYDSYHYDGKYFTISGWYDPGYQGYVMVKGLTLEYYPMGSTTPAYTVTAGDEETLSNWLFERPITPDSARSYASFQESAVKDAYPGYTLYSYSVSSIGRLLADALYMKIEDGLLYIKAVGFDAAADPMETDLIPVPLSADILALGEDPLIAQFRENGDWILRQLSPMPFDGQRLALNGKIVDFDIQACGFIALTEDEAGVRRLSVVSLDEKGNYHTKTTRPLPENTYLDTFHAGEGDIQFEWDGQRQQAGFALSSSGEWQLSWVMNSSENGSFDYSASFYKVQSADDLWFIGSLSGFSLWEADLDALPATEAQLKAAIDRTGWAVVNNPDPADRLHLREKPDRSSDSLGKFYNGTPVKILKEHGDWCQVQIGTNGFTGWMMKQYLVEGAKMDSVRWAFPDLFLKAEYYENPVVYSKPNGMPDMPRDHDFDLIGVYQDAWYILMTQDGEIGYAPMDWFFPGNG